MQYGIKIKDWAEFGQNLENLIERSTLSLAYILMFYDLKARDLILEKGLPSRIKIPISMDLVEQLSRFAPTTHSVEVHNNIVIFIWD